MPRAWRGGRDPVRLPRRAAGGLPAQPRLDGRGRAAAYLEAFRELVLPQTEVLVGNHKTLTDFLLPDWDSERPPSARELAVAAGEHGTRFVLVTSVLLPARARAGPVSTTCWPRRRAPSPARSSSASRPPSSAPATRCRPRWPHCWPPAAELHTAVGEALAFLDQALDAGFRPGMGNVVPDRFFWALPPGEEGDGPPEAEPRTRRRPARHDTLTPPGAAPAASTDPKTNASLFERAQRVIPGGVNSPVRAFRAVGGTPRFIARAQGPYMWDAEGTALHRLHRLLGPDDPGPRPPGGAGRGAEGRAGRLLFGAPTEREVELAEEILAGAQHGAGAAGGQLGHRGRR
jgi:hypothetical protein